jgi:heme-degrading monooxygenase HmoA
MGLERKPVLMLTALHLRSMTSLPPYFWRVRRLERALRRQDGFLRAHRWLSRRSLLLTSWWRDRETAEAWLKHPAHDELVRLVQGDAGASLWVEFYELSGGGLFVRARGAPEAGVTGAGGASGT